jgi:hypothetical protein
VPERIDNNDWVTLEVGDYIEGKGAVVWKVTRRATKADGDYIGIENAAGEKKIVGPLEELKGAVTRLVYGPVATMEEATGLVEKVLGGKVLAQRHEHVWVHPSHEHLEATPGLTAAHLVRFHGDYAKRTQQPEDVVIRIHRELHQHGKSDHTHPEEN